MSEQNIVFLDRATVAPQVDITKPTTAHTWQQFDRTEHGQVVERLRGATVAITNKVPIRAEDLDKLPELKLIAVAATGYDVVDVAAAHKRGIPVCNVRGYATNTVPEHTFSLILALRRSLVPYRESVINGRWQEVNSFCYFDYPIRDLSGCRLGIFGEGSIGQSVANIAKAFGMEPVFAAHKGVKGLGPLYTPFDEVIASADIITMHAPLTPATRDMISTAEFNAMTKKPIIINTARGGLINEEAAAKALESEKISGIGFDVLTKEPPDSNNPLMRVLSHHNVIVTPHIAWASIEAQQEVWRQVICAVDGHFDHAPFNVIQPS